MVEKYSGLWVPAAEMHSVFRLARTSTTTFHPPHLQPPFNSATLYLYSQTHHTYFRLHSLRNMAFARLLDKKSHLIPGKAFGVCRVGNTHQSDIACAEIVTLAYRQGVRLPHCVPVKFVERAILVDGACAMALFISLQRGPGLTQQPVRLGGCSPY